MDASRAQPPKTERDLFLEAIDRPTPGERTAFLDEACAHEPSLRAAVEALLLHHKEDGFLETSAFVLPPGADRSGTAPPVVVGGFLYVLGMGGDIACLQAKDGKIVWRHSLTGDFGGRVPMWSYHESPLVDGNKVICTPGGQDAILVALDKSTGKTIWMSQMPGEHAVQRVTAVQNEYSMMARDPEADILPICRELGIGFVCWSPLAMAFLAGAIDQDTALQRGDFRAMVPWFAPDNRAGNLAIVALVKGWARRKGATPAQIALTWLLAQEPWIVPIPGTTKTPHLLDNLGADAVRFTPEEVRELNAALASTPVHGARLPAGVLRLSGVEAPPKQG